MLKFFNELLYNEWALNTTAALKERNLKLNGYEHNPTKLYFKLWKNAEFFSFCNLNFLPSWGYWTHTATLFKNFPTTWHPSYFENYLETTPEERRANDEFLEPIESVVLKACHKLMVFWLYLPVFLTDFLKYYPYYTYYTKTLLPFDEIELEYLDCWIQILPVFEDILGHLLINDTPFTESGYYEPFFSRLTLKAPMLEDINFSEHLKEYYFGEDSIPEFKDVLNLYLDIRPELKNRCIASLAQDKQLNHQITDDLAVYFISHFLIKGISKYTLRFLVANLDLSNKNPAKNYRDAQTEEWNSSSLEEKNSSLYWRDNPPPYYSPLPWPPLPLPASLPWPKLPVDKKNS